MVPSLSRRPIAIITENFPPCSGGGIAEWAYGLARNLPQFGYEVTVLSRWQGSVDKGIHRDQPFRLWCMKGHDWRHYRFFYSLYYLLRWARRSPGGILLATTWELARAAALIRRRYRLKLILLAHGLEVTRLRTASQSHRLKRVLDRSDVIVAVSQFTRREILRRVSLHPDRVKVISPGVDPERFHRDEDFGGLTQRWGLRRDQPLLLTLARVIERKGHDTVIRSLPDVIERFPGATYLIAGPWRDSVRRRLEELIEALGVRDHVIFTGFVHEHELNKLYSMADVYVMVSKASTGYGDSEGFGITFLEASACQTPVIGSYSGGIPDAIQEGHSGLLVQPDDPQQLSSKILYLLQNPKLARRMGGNGRTRVEQGYTWPKVTERLVREIESSEGL